MAILTLYYPSFVDQDGAPEKVMFNELADLEGNEAVKSRMFGPEGLRETYAYETLEPEFYDGAHYYITVFHKDGNGYYGAARISSESADGLKAALEKLGTKAVPKDKW